MKGREGIPEKHAFGPAPGPGTVWVVTTKQGETKQATGETAFKAAAFLGMSLGQVAHIAKQ